MKKIVFIRLDKIGDLISTLPVDQIFELRGYEKHWVISKGLRFLCDNSVNSSSPEFSRNVIELDPKNSRQSRKELEDFLKIIKPDIVVSFYSPWWVGLACWKAQIPLRVTRYSQWHSFLFFNSGLRQKRTLAEKHEADYNLDLVFKALKIQLKPQEYRKTPTLELKVGIRRNMFERLQVSPLQYVVVHPGMAGSALNWPQQKYNDLISGLVEVTTVVLTGTPGDSPYLTEIKPRWEHHPKVRYVQNQLSMDELLVVLNSAGAIIAPSTGVAHLAASLSRPVVAIFSPIRTHQARRWAPRGEWVTVIDPGTENPQIQCPEIIKCQGARCPHYECMSRISVESVLKAAVNYLTDKPKPPNEK